MQFAETVIIYCKLFWGDSSPFNQMDTEYWEFTVRSGTEITKNFIVQGRGKEDCTELAERLLITSCETILYSREVTHMNPKGMTLQEFVDRMDVEYLLCTGGKWPTMVFNSNSIEYQRKKGKV